MSEAEDKSSESCCGGANADSSASCGCGTPKKKSRVKLFIFAGVMLAALGVGAYSLIAKSSAVPCAGQTCDPKSGSCCPK
jgi:hypothetical protein